MKRRRKRWRGLPDPVKTRLLHPTLLILFSLACFWPGQRSIPPIDRDEARYAEAARQMAASGDLVDIRFQGQPRYQKPAGIYWLQALAVTALGEDKANPIWPYRLPSLLGAIGAVLATYALGRVLFDPAAGFVAALLFAASLLLNIEARLATVEAMLLFATTVALGCLGRLCFPSETSPYPFRKPLSPTRGRGYEDQAVRSAAPVEVGEGDSLRNVAASIPAQIPTAGPLTLAALSAKALSFASPLPLGEGIIFIAILFWLALAAGIILKGPLILLVVGLTILGAGQPRQTIKALRPAWGILLTLALAAPWYILITLRSHGAFWVQSLGHDLGDKLLAGQEGHGAWPGTYLLELPLAFWPATPFVLAALPFAWAHRHQPRIRFLLAAIVPCWLVLECIPTKLPHYILPLFPPLAALTAAALQAGTSAFWQRARLYQRHWLPGLLGLALLAYGIGFGLVLPRLATPFIMREFVAHRRTYPAALQAGPVALAGFHEPSAVLWLGPETELLSGPAAAQALANGTVKLALISPDEAATFTGSAFIAFDRLSGYNYAGGHDVALTVYRRAD